MLFSVQVSDDRRGEMTPERTVHILEYVLKEELLVLQPGEPLTQPSLDLLTSIFNYCELRDPLPQEYNYYDNLYFSWQL